MGRPITAPPARRSRPRTAARCGSSRRARVRCITSLTDQGQGTLTSVAQIVADSVGISIDLVSVAGGDSSISPYGGGAWASRGTAVGGEAALRAGGMLKQNILALAGTITQTPADALDIVDGQVVNTRTGQRRHQPR